MFKFKFFCLSLLLLVASTLPQDENNEMRVNNEQSNGVVTSLVKKYTVSLVAGACFGALEGTGCLLIDKIVPIIFPLNWISSHYSRKAIIANGHTAMKEKGIECDEAVMNYSGWIVSWGSYLMLARLIQFNSVIKIEQIIKSINEIQKKPNQNEL